MLLALITDIEKFLFSIMDIFFFKNTLSTSKAANYFAYLTPARI